MLDRDTLEAIFACVDRDTILASLTCKQINALRPSDLRLAPRCIIKICIGDQALTKDKRGGMEEDGGEWRSHIFLVKCNQQMSASVRETSGDSSGIRFTKGGVFKVEKSKSSLQTHPDPFYL
jgi:hypothetical protein